jgi:hypothetical protein
MLVYFYFNKPLLPAALLSSGLMDPESPYAPDGVDLTLIRWMLAMTPAERLEALQSWIDSLWEAWGDEAETRVLFHTSDTGSTPRTTARSRAFRLPGATC